MERLWLIFFETFRLETLLRRHRASEFIGSRDKRREHVVCAAVSNERE
jgi:hypothetical protein